MAKIAVIPIDNRPVCYRLPIQIANLDKNNKTFIPEINLLGDLRRNADTEALLLWLDSLKDIDFLIVCLDTIAYGGLIPSRRCDDDFETVKSRIDKLCEIIDKKKIKVHAFSSIMRISNNNVNEEEKEYWNLYGKRIFEYSYNLHKTEKNCAGENLLACNCAASRIPDEILQDYLNTRKRNHRINKYYLELAKNNIFDTLVFSKDDCAQYGLNVKEAEELALLAKDYKNIFVKTGADEIPLTLLSRALNKDKHIKIAPIYTQSDYIDKISKYEDISVEKSVNSQIELSGGIVSDIEHCDMVLLVNNFKNEQGELVMDVVEPLFSGKLQLPDKPYFIADILNANGSDNNFVKALFEQKNLKEFFGYAAWNTTGNTLGSALSCALTYFGAKYPDKNVFQNLQITRFLDDWAYQANIRAQIRTNSENLSNTVLKVRMKDFENIIFSKFGIKRMQVKYKFPWNRFFEVEIGLKNNYVKLPFVDILFCE